METRKSEVVLNIGNPIAYTASKRYWEVDSDNKKFLCGQTAETPIKVMTPYSHIATGGPNKGHKKQ